MQKPSDMFGEIFFGFTQVAPQYNRRTWGIIQSLATQGDEDAIEAQAVLKAQRVDFVRYGPDTAHQFGALVVVGSVTRFANFEATRLTTSEEREIIPGAPLTEREAVVYAAKINSYRERLLKCIEALGLKQDPFTFGWFLAMNPRRLV